MDNHPGRLRPKEEMFGTMDLRYTNWVIQERVSAKQLLALSLIATASQRDIRWVIPEFHYDQIIDGSLLILYYSHSKVFIGTPSRSLGEYIVKYDDVINWLTNTKT